MQDFYGKYSIRIHEGTIIVTNPLTYTAKVRLPGGRIADDVPWLSPYSFLNGNGMYAMPQNNADVLVAEYGYCQFAILGFMSHPDGLPDSTNKTTGDDRTVNKRRIGMGDICIQASDQCYFLMRRVAEHIALQASPKCYLHLNNANNTININSQRARVTTDAADLIMDSDAKTLNTTTSWIFRDSSTEKSNILFVKIGFHNTEDSEALEAGIDKSIFSLIVRETESSDDDILTSVPKFKFIVGVNGRILCSAESIMEKYRDFIDRYADTFIKDIAKKDITRQSLEENIADTAEKDLTRESKTANITDTAKKIATTYAKLIRHNKGSN